MKIKEITDEAIYFDNGMRIWYDHEADCCEWNYADFKQLDDLARNYKFNENLKFEAVEDAGFKFGDSKRMFFVPCYSEQNGYYSCDIEIWFFNGHTSEQKLLFDCEFVEY